jgi:hypothetical protein
MLTISNRLWEVGQADDGGWMTWLWPWWFATAGILALMWAVRPESRVLLALSGAFAVSAMVSRAAATVLQLTAAAHVLTAPSLHIAGIVWTTLAAAVAYVWLTDFRAVTTILRAGRGR